MEVWNIDADRIKLDDQWDGISLIRNKEIDNFLEKDDKLFVVAAKGLGKTLLLKAKSKRLRDGHGDAIHIPKTELCEKIGKSLEDISYSRDEFEKFHTRKQWHSIWTLCLYVTLCQHRDINMPLELDRMFSGSRNLTSNLNILLKERARLHELSGYVSSCLASSIAEINMSTYIYIDNIDEAFDDYVGYLIDEKLGQRGAKAWIFSQLGLMDAAKQLYHLNRHIKVYTSIRIEAFNSSSSATDLQMQDYCCFLKYSKSEVEKIFKDNIQHMNPVDLCEPDAKDPIRSFLGMSTIDHPIVKSNGHKVAEKMFDYLYRHTFGRPREIVYMGKRIKDIRPVDRTIETIRGLVNECAHKLFDQYEKEFIPFFDAQEFELFSRYVKSSILARKNIEMIANKIKDENRLYPHVFCSFYKKGLLGFVKRDSGNKAVQHFEPIGEKLFESDGCLPKSKFYLIHPALCEVLKKNDDRFVISRDNIIGDGRRFYADPLEFEHPPNSTERGSRKVYHVHFGAGQLGLGLVLPLFFDSYPMCIVQRVSNKWLNMGSEKITIRSGGRDYEFQMITNETDITRLSEFMRAKINIFAIVTNPRLLSEIMNGAQFATTAVGSKAIRGLAHSMLVGSYNEEFNVYAFENDARSVKGFRDEIEKQSNSIKIIDVVADKICSGVQINKKTSFISVSSEEYQEVVVSTRNKKVHRDFEDLVNLSKNGVRLVSDSDEYRFLYHKKLWIVNGMHLFLGIYAMKYLQDKKIPSNSRKHHPVSTLVDIDEIRGALEVFGGIQVIRLLTFFDKKLLCESLGTSNIDLQYRMLMEYVLKLIKRLSCYPDQLGRLFPGKLKILKMKYDDRLKDITNFYKQNTDDVSKVLGEISDKTYTIDEIDRYLQSYTAKLVDLILE